MSQSQPITIEAIRARYEFLCAERDATEQKIAPLRQELADAAAVAEVHRVKAMKVRERLDAARGGEKWFALKKEIGLLARALGGQANDDTWSDITEITPGNGYTDDGNTLDSEAWAETGAGTGIWQFTSADEVITASGGSIGPFRYPIVYNDTPTSPVDPLIGYLDYGSSITVTTGNTFTFDVGANGIFRLGTGVIS
jgi:hypothetical protein